MGEKFLTEDTIIEIGKSVPLYKFRAFFQEATGEDLSGWEFQPWLNTQAGKTIKEALASYCETAKPKSMENLLSEERFNIVSEADKSFILDFDKAISGLRYDSGGAIGDGYCWGKYMIIYSKIGVKNKKVIARIFIKENEIVLRLFFNDIDKHRKYIECAPGHIKSVFVGNYGDCNCNPQKETCRMRKTYTIDGKLIKKCSGVVFIFWNPATEKLIDYINLLAEFYPVKKARSV
jgi:hypothetical protein